MGTAPAIFVSCLHRFRTRWLVGRFSQIERGEVCSIPRCAPEQTSRRPVVDRCRKSDAARTSRIAGPLFEQDLNGTRSETEHAELLLADRVGRVDRLRLTEIGNRIIAAAQ